MSSSEGTDCQPPAVGSPCWVEVPALDVKRAKEFYATAWNWEFKTYEGTYANYNEENLAMFNFPGKMKLNGGILKMEEANIRNKKIGALIYMWVDDIEKQNEKIKKANGKVVGEPYKEGDHGIIQQFEDTEGNLGAMYKYVGTNP